MSVAQLSIVLCLLLTTSLVAAPARRKVIINEDMSGPGGSNLQTLLLLVQSPEVEVLGITLVTGDQWRDEEAAHTLRLLEIIGRTDIPVMLGAVNPLVRTREETKLAEQAYGRVFYAGAWNEQGFHEASVVPPLPEGRPSAKPSSEDAVHFILRMVHQYPNEITIYEGGPMTNLALAVSLDPSFASLAQQLVFMGGSLNPQSDYAEFVNDPRHEFNFWFDPEAAHIVLRAPWKKIVCTPVDISIKVRLKPELIEKIAAAGTPIATYLKKYYVPGEGNDYMWDELAAAAWLDPTLITKKETRYMSVDISHGPHYGDTVTWSDADRPSIAVQPVEIQLDLDLPRLLDKFESLMTAPTPAR